MGADTVPQTSPCRRTWGRASLLLGAAGRDEAGLRLVCRAYTHCRPASIAKPRILAPEIPEQQRLHLALFEPTVTTTLGTLAFGTEQQAKRELRAVGPGRGVGSRRSCRTAARASHVALPAQGRPPDPWRDREEISEHAMMYGGPRHAGLTRKDRPRGSRPRQPPRDSAVEACGPPSPLRASPPRGLPDCGARAYA